MPDHDWKRIESLFFEALELRPEDRPEFLITACAGNDGLLEEVRGMLAAHLGDQSLEIERLVADTETAGAPQARSSHEPFNGQQVGPYRLVRLLGEGGMGAVYLAERTDEYQQQVALKLVRSGHLPEELVARFRQERQILARLEHPGIAAILDGGVLDDGRPYLVLQYVDGAPVTKYCEVQELSIKERLRLFVTVCRVVQFAHANLVVHRDLKPSNILVTADGQVKLLDFGIAKLLNSDTDTPRLSRAGIRIMTPEHAAPEQVRGETITTATDVYALGILLYEMLTGRRPFTFTRHSPTEIERVVCEEAPTPPSSMALRTQDATHSADSPGERKPKRLVDGELDQIILTALHKAPEQRYDSAGQLADDVERYLTGQPIIAEQDTVWYRTRKFVGRNKVAVAIALGIVVLVGAFLVTTVVQAKRVERERDLAQLERDKAQGVVDLVVDLFQTSNPQVAPGSDTMTVAAFLDRGESEIAELSDQPELQASMREVLAKAFVARSQLDRGRSLMQEAHDWQRANLGADHPDAVSTFHELALLTRQLESPAAAEPLMRQSVDNHRRIYGDQNVEVAQALQDLATVTLDDEESRVLLEEAVAIRRDLLPPDDVAIADGHNALGYIHWQRGDYAGARNSFISALEVLQLSRADYHPEVLTVSGNLANTHAQLGEWEASERINRRVLEVRKRVEGAESGGVASSLEALGAALTSQSRYGEALESFQQARAIYETVLGADHWRVSNTTRNVAMLLYLDGRPDEALPHIDEAIEINTKALGERAPAYLRGQRGVILMSLGRGDAAVDSIRLVLPIIDEDARSEDHPYRGDVRAWLAIALLSRGSFDEAESMFRESLAMREAGYPENHPKVAESRCGLGAALAARGASDEARELLAGAMDRYLEWGQRNPLLAAMAQETLAQLNAR